ncbi:MAG: Crp/Fnr family transcriptional regulator [Bacteroidota bacterium]
MNTTVHTPWNTAGYYKNWQGLIEINKKLYKKDTILFQEGDLPEGIFLLIDGIVKISRSDKEGNERIIKIATSGDLLGTVTFNKGKQNSTTGTVFDDSIICFISISDLSELMKKNPGFSRQLVVKLCEQLNNAENRIISISDKTVEERLAETLLVLSASLHSRKKTIKISRKSLAEIIGFRTETVIRALSKFKKREIITVHGCAIEFLDFKRLESICLKRAY